MYKFMQRKRIMFLMSLVFVVSMLNAAPDKNAGEYGLVFLKIPVSPEQAAMGNTGDMNHSSPLTLLHHPVSFNWERGASVAASQTSWLVDTNMYNLAWRNVMFNQAFGLGLVYLDYGKIDKRTEDTTQIGTYYPMDLKATANYVRKLNPVLHAGASVNLIYEKIDSSSALAFSTDLGIAYLTPLRNTSVDFAIKNLGSSTKMDKEKIDLPKQAELGMTTGFDLSEVMSIYPALKLTYMDDHEDILPSVGVNIKVYEMLFLRAGYKFNYNEEDLSAGFGIHYKNFAIDYSFMNNLSNIHMFGIGWSF